MHWKGVLTNGFKFDMGENDEDTWAGVWDTVKAALRKGGYNTRLILQNRKHVSHPDEM